MTMSKIWSLPASAKEASNMYTKIALYNGLTQKSLRNTPAKFATPLTSSSPRTIYLPACFSLLNL